MEFEFDIKVKYFGTGSLWGDLISRDSECSGILGYPFCAGVTAMFYIAVN